MQPRLEKGLSIMVYPGVLEEVLSLSIPPIEKLLSLNPARLFRPSRSEPRQSRDGPKAAGGGSSSNTSVLIAQGFLHPACKMFHLSLSR